MLTVSNPAKSLLLGCFVIYLTGVINCYAGSGDLPEKEVVAILKGNDRKKQREVVGNMYDTYENIKEIYRTPEVGEALYELLTLIAKPTDYIMPAHPQKLSETILRAMGDYKETRAISYLVNNIYNPDFRYPLAKIGQPAIEPVLEKLKHGNSDQKFCAMDVFEIMLTTRSPTIISDGKEITNPDMDIPAPTGNALEKIRAELKIEINDKDPNVRRQSIKVLSLINNPDDKALLERASKITPQVRPVKLTPDTLKRLKEQMSGPLYGD